MAHISEMINMLFMRLKAEDNLFKIRQTVQMSQYLSCLNVMLMLWTHYHIFISSVLLIYVSHLITVKKKVTKFLCFLSSILKCAEH